MFWVLVKDEMKKDELDIVLYNLCEFIRIIVILINFIMNEIVNKIYEYIGIKG